MMREVGEGGEKFLLGVGWVPLVVRQAHHEGAEEGVLRLKVLGGMQNDVDSCRGFCHVINIGAEPRQIPPGSAGFFYDRMKPGPNVPRLLGSGRPLDQRADPVGQLPQLLVLCTSSGRAKARPYCRARAAFWKLDRLESA
ncbi:hypothetical protein SI859A1_00755 [Aurantimonas manganoxydans SI85-9A1]|uniref:Uncharacterized protein n=1 Tax=Aurantimonas manganoxydans (strain ATCC BAA-1229 / DSM 21871 / SI85-9A1) TaxID=287752 RepID=Q1YK88_AURMS|nr:hypothetical protein SI859A1_00755 [Aurantimonas manganoxydans SI85-9A1]